MKGPIYAARLSRARVLAAFFAAWLSPLLPFVLTAFMAARWREAAPRVLADLRAWRERLCLDAAECPSLFKTPEIARERVLDARFVLLCFPLRRSRFAFLRTCDEALPFLGACSFTPALRAFESPMAIACLVD